MLIIASFAEHTRERCFPPATWSRLEQLAKNANAQLHWVPWIRPEPTTQPPFASTCKNLAGPSGPDVLLTGWGMPTISPQVLDACPNLQLIVHSAGTVFEVDIDAWRRHIKVTNVMPVMSYAVAEFAICLALNGLRRFNAHVRPELHDSSPFYSAQRSGFALMNKRIGLVGLGIIAREVIARLNPWRCEIVAYDPFVSAEQAAAQGAKKLELDELLATSDVISLHAPGTDALKNLLDERRLRLLKPGAVLVNTARGIIIDHDALARVAAEGNIGVYLDVTCPEPLPDNHPLRKLDNVTLTGHIAGPTAEQHPLMGEAALDQLENFLKGHPLQNLVTQAQYQNQSRS